jgi:hypothetical protein
MWWPKYLIALYKNVGRVARMALSKKHYLVQELPACQSCHQPIRTNPSTAPIYPKG